MNELITHTQNLYAPSHLNTPICVSFSGGKDSVATYLYLARDLGFTNVTCIFCDTGHESKVTYEYLERLRREFSFPLVHHQPLMRDLWVNPPDRPDLDEPLTMETLAIHKHRFPSPSARFCTTYLKMAPYKRWLRENASDSTILASGVRAQESTKRAQIAPWHFDDYMGFWRALPIHSWSSEEVFDCHRRHGIPPNPLYTMGSSRVGCYPCIMARKSELKEIAKRDPKCFDDLRAMEVRVSATLTKKVMTFFSRDDTSQRYRSTIDVASGLHVPTADDVRRWATDDTPNFKEGELFLGEEQYDMDGEDLTAHACSSPYGLCE